MERRKRRNNTNRPNWTEQVEVNAEVVKWLCRIKRDSCSGRGWGSVDASACWNEISVILISLP